MEDPKRREDLKKIEDIFDKSAWLRNNLLEPVVGNPSCPREVEKYGIRGASCYTTFVEDNENGTYGCLHERCHPFQFPSLELAIRHQRCHHFNHRPYECTNPLNGGTW